MPPGWRGSWICVGKAGAPISSRCAGAAGSGTSRQRQVFSRRSDTEAQHGHTRLGGAPLKHRPCRSGGLQGARGRPQLLPSAVLGGGPLARQRGQKDTGVFHGLFSVAPNAERVVRCFAKPLWGQFTFHEKLRSHAFLINTFCHHSEHFWCTCVSVFMPGAWGSDQGARSKTILP